jgi:histidinol-phosphatase (PHP family)
MRDIHPTSIHGGHSGQFCSHASDTLEEIVLAYIDQGYPWVGITEHMPPVSDAFVYPEEQRAGLDAAALGQRFADYMAVCRRLQSSYADRIRIFVGFETDNRSDNREPYQIPAGLYDPPLLELPSRTGPARD